MAKKTKLKLENLRVESFLTSLNEKEKKVVKGGNLVLQDSGKYCWGPLPSQPCSGGFDPACGCPPETV